MILVRTLSFVLCFCLTLCAHPQSQTSDKTNTTLVALPPVGLTYSTTRYLNRVTYLTAFAVADINHDGVPDLIAADFDSYQLSISLGDLAHPGTFLAPYFITVLTRSANVIVVADLNRDGLPDIVYGDTARYFAGLLFQDPLHPGSFVNDHSLSTTFAQPLIADINHDGIPDIVLYEDNRGIILLGDGGHLGSFLPPTPLMVGLAGVSAALLVDMNGDGLPDLVTSNDTFTQTISVSLNDPAYPGTFGPAQDYPAGGYSADLVAGDLNGDGFPDIILGGTPSSIIVLLNDATRPGTLLPPHVYMIANAQAGAQSSGIALGDVNGDGKLDVVRGDFGSVFNVLLGNGDGSFSPATTYPTGPIPESFWSTPVVIADIDGDGLQDVLVGQFFQNSIQVFAHRPSATPLAISATEQILRATSVRPGDAVILTIKVSAFQGTPSGTITLYDVTRDRTGAPVYTSITVLPLTNTGTAVYTDHFQSGTRTFCSFYSGDQVYAPSTSLFVTASITANPTVNLNLTATPNPALPGQDVVLTATLPPLSPVPTGSVVFLDGGTAITSIPLTATGIAVLHTSSLALGTHVLTALYSGDGNYAGQQAHVAETIQNPTIQLSIVSSSNPTTVGQPITFTAKVAASNPVPTGSVSFTDDAVPSAVILLAADGSAVYTTAFSSAGSHPIQAMYSGDGNYAPQSTALTEVVVSPTPPPMAGDYTLTTGAPLTLGSALSGTAALSATPLNGLADTVTLSCGSLPLYVTCRVVPSTVGISGGTRQQAAIQIGINQFSGGNGLQTASRVLSTASLPLLCLILPLRWRRVRGRRNWLRLISSLFAVSILPLLAGCGYSKSPLLTPAGTYSIVMHGQGTASHLERSATLTLIVQR